MLQHTEEYSDKEADALNGIVALRLYINELKEQADTWLYSEGYVYEALWNARGKNLFEKTRIKDFIWNSSLIVVPPDAVALLNAKTSSIVSLGSPLMNLISRP